MRSKNNVPKSMWFGKPLDKEIPLMMWKERPITLINIPGIWVRDLSRKTALVQLKWLRMYKLTRAD